MYVRQARSPSSGASRVTVLRRPAADAPDEAEPAIGKGNMGSALMGSPQIIDLF